MATRLRSVSRPAISLLRTFTSRPTTPISPNLLPRSSLSFSRIKPQMGCLESMLPFHSAVASARMTSRLCLGSAGSRTMCQELGLSVPR